MEDVPNNCLRFEDTQGAVHIADIDGRPSGATVWTSCTPGFLIIAHGEGVVGVTGNLW